MKKSTRFFKGFRKFIITAFIGFLIVIFVAGVEVHISYNTSKAKKTIWDKAEKIVKLIKHFV